MATIEFFDRDVGVSISAIVAVSGSAVNLSGAAVTLLVAPQRAFAMSIISAASGTVEYTVSAGDFPFATQYLCQIRWSAGSGTFHLSTFLVTVKRSLTALG
ncbi:MAG TPA: hypothetical protein VNP04_13685 [Alphaproteobacteria bacterium]|nr:hypothetical protein [Alphaproteobacteria bacterium]